MAAQLLGDLFLNGITGAPSGSVRFYQPQSLIPITVWSNDGATQANTQPVQQDANGKSVVPIYLTVPARMIVYSSSGAQLMDVERVDGTRAETAILANTLWPGETSVNAALTALATSLGGKDGNFLAAGTGAIARLVQAKLSEQLSVKDFGAIGNGVADDTGAIVAAVTAATALGGGLIFFPAGTYLVSQPITIAASNIAFNGTGSAASVIKNSSSTTGCVIISGAATSSVTLDSIGLSNSATSTGAAVTITVANSNSNILFNRIAITGHRTGISQPSGQLGGSGLVVRDCAIVCDNNAASVCVSALSASNGQIVFYGSSFDVGGTTSATCISISCSSQAAFTAFGGTYNPGTAGTAFFLVGATLVANLYGPFLSAGTLYSVTGGMKVMVFVDQTYSSNPGTTAGVFYVNPRLGSWGDTGPLTSQTINATGPYVPDVTLYNCHRVIGGTGGITITISNPATTPQAGSRVTFLFSNISGGAVTWAFGTTYKIAAVAPASPLQIGVVMVFDGTNYIEVSRGSAAPT